MRDRIRLALSAYRPQELPVQGHRDSAVLLLLHEQDGVEHVLFQVRTFAVEHHRGEIGFPGGGREPHDASLLHTALRETREEIGVAEADIEVFGQLDDTITASTNFLIRPYVGAIRAGASAGFEAAPLEVRELLRVPLDHLRSPEAQTMYLVDRGGQPAATPAYRYGDHVIWGATARVLSQFLGLIAVPADAAVEAQA